MNAGKRRCTPRIVAIVALVMVLGVGMAAYFGRFHGEILGFFRIGTVLPPSPYLNDIPAGILFKGELGYDGQFFLALALDPSLSHRGSVAALDNPRYRYRRIFYPYLASLFSFGHRRWIPYLLVGINAACLVGIVFILALWFQKTGESPWLGLLGLGITGVWIVFFLSTADLLASFLLSMSVYAYVRGRTWLTAFGMAAAGLTHETLLLVLGAIWLDALFRRDKRDVALLSLAVVPAGIWNFHVLQVLPSQGSTAGVFEAFTLPGMGLARKLGSIVTTRSTLKALYEGGAFFLLLGQAVSLGVVPVREQFYRVVWYGGGIYLLLLAFISMHILGYYIDYTRIFMNIGLFLVMTLFVTSRRKAKIGILAASCLMSALFVVAYVMGLI